MKAETQNEKLKAINRLKGTLIGCSYLNNVRFSSLRSLELSVIQSWSNTKG